jgi:hypothetical protein
MIQRCHNPKSSHYKNYGGKGVTVCERWRQSFAAFFADMGRRPGDNYTLERKDPRRGYYPSNCCWILRKEQARNRRDTIRLTLDGVTFPLSEWAERRGIPYDLLSRRWRDGWSDAEILNTPYKARKAAVNSV